MCFPRDLLSGGPQENVVEPIATEEMCESNRVDNMIQVGAWSDDPEEKEMTVEMNAAYWRFGETVPDIKQLRMMTQFDSSSAPLLSRSL